MTVPDELLEVLACPKCHGPIEPSADGQALDCAHDRLRFPIVEDIPILILEEAVPIKDGA